MLEVAWLLAAVEINGALASKGARVALTDEHCLIERAAIVQQVSEKALLRTADPLIVSVHRSRCHFEDETQVLRIRLAADELATRTLILSEGPGPASITLLHDPKSLAASSGFMAQPLVVNLPAVALDVFAGNRFRGLGAILTNGPWSIQNLSQHPQGQAALRRSTVEYLTASAGQIRIGDFRATSGPDQRLGEFIGLSVSNRAGPLRGDGKTESFLAVSNPSRVQFLDRLGVPVYSTEILAPGNYQVQGYGASTTPGFLQARLIDEHGNSQSVLLPWTADRRLVSQGQWEWDAFMGRSRPIETRSESPSVGAAVIRYGLQPDVTLALHAEHLGSQKRLMAEATSRGIPAVVYTAALGPGCTADGCKPSWLIEARASPGPRLMITAAHSRATGFQQAAGLPQEPASITNLQLSGAASDRVSGMLSWSEKQHIAITPEQSLIASVVVRLSKEATVSVQARRTAAAGQPHAWSAQLGLSIYFAAQRTHASISWAAQEARASRNAQSYPVLQLQRMSQGPYGPQISIGHVHDDRPRSDAFIRYASRKGDLSVRAATQAAKPSWSASGRLWYADGRLMQSPAGDENLVVQQLGEPDIRVIHRARETEVSDAQGRLVFRRAPIWTDATYSLDPKTIPFGLNIAASRVRIPLAANRVYHVDYRPLWSRVQTWRLPSQWRAEYIGIDQAINRHAKPVYLNADGYLDLQSIDELPIRIQPRSGLTLICTAPATRQSKDEELELWCEKDRAL